MREISLAKKYSKAFVETLKNEEEFNRSKDELNSFKMLLDSDDAFKAGIETPMLGWDQKAEILKIVSDKLGLMEKTTKFLSVIAEENRMIYFDMIYEQLDICWFEQAGIESVKVETVVPLNEGQERLLIEKLSDAFNKRIVIEKEINKSLIAGIKIIRGSVLYDFSVDGNLKKLRETLISGMPVREN